MIDYSKIANSISFYEEKGFKRIESPWTVSRYTDEITKSTNTISFELKHNNKRLVASGEQSFLYLYLKGFLPKGKFQTVTPCFRFESFDNLHSKYFIKNELIDTEAPHVFRLAEIVKTSLEFFQQYIPEAEIMENDDDTFDIVYGDYELGSYGIRETNFLKWIYATGCAEPRLTTVMNIKNKANGIS